MTRPDLLCMLGLLLIVLGFGGGVEMWLIGQSSAYQAMWVAHGDTNPAQFAGIMHRSIFYLTLGVPIGMAGVVLLVIAFRGYAMLNAVGRGTASE